MPDQPADKPPQEIVDYVAEHAPGLDPEEVGRFMSEHPKPDDEPVSHLAWAVSVIRQRTESEFGEGLPVERVVRELRDRGRGRGR